MTNSTCVKYSMGPQAYNFVSTNAHEISGYTFLSIVLHSRAPNLGGISGDVQSHLATLAFKKGEQLEYFHGRILILQQEIMLYGEIIFSNRLLFQYMKELSNNDNTRDSSAPNMTYLITLHDNNEKSAIYTVGDIIGIYRYLEIIGFPTTLTTSGKRSNVVGNPIISR